MHKFEKFLREYMNNELVVDFKSKFLDHILTTHQCLIEREATKNLYDGYF